MVCKMTHHRTVKVFKNNKLLPYTPRITVQAHANRFLRTANMCMPKCMSTSWVNPKIMCESEEWSQYVCVRSTHIIYRYIVTHSDNNVCYILHILVAIFNYCTCWQRLISWYYLYYYTKWQQKQLEHATHNASVALMYLLTVTVLHLWQPHWIVSASLTNKFAQGCKYLAFNTPRTFNYKTMFLLFADN